MTTIRISNDSNPNFPWRIEVDGVLFSRVGTEQLALQLVDNHFTHFFGRHGSFIPTNNGYVFVDTWGETFEVCQ